MKANRPIALMILAVLSLAAIAARAERIAVVEENNLNVRGRPSFIGEVITQLQKGEQVVVLEDIPVSKPKPGEPTQWHRIRMPANTPVWVFAPFVEPSTKAVNTSRLNMRAGPGENYSVLGRLERGEVVKTIRTVDDWMEIETPKSAEAYVAGDFLTFQEEQPATPKPEETAKTEPPPAETPAPTPQAPVESAPAPASSVRTDPTPEPVPVEETPVPAPGTIHPAPALEPTATALLPIAIVPEPASEPPIVTTVTAEASEPPRRRIVRREGIIRGTRSIQAPTYFELVSRDTGKVINYLQVKNKTEALDLKEYKGKAVIASGEEGIAPRWPTIPILMIETLDLVP